MCYSHKSRVLKLKLPDYSGRIQVLHGLRNSRRLEKTFGRKEANETAGIHKDLQDLRIQVSFAIYLEQHEYRVVTGLRSIGEKKKYWYRREWSIGIIEAVICKQFCEKYW